jgi:hypothetical protein
MLGWAHCGFYKKCAGTHYTELVFLHQVESAGHILHSTTSEEKNVDALSCMVMWDRYRLDKKRAGTHYSELVFLHPVGSVGHVVDSLASGHETSMQYFSCSGGPSAVFIKSALGHVTLN